MFAMQGSACLWTVSVSQDVKRLTLSHAGARRQQVAALAWLRCSGWDEDVQCHLGAGELPKKDVSDLLAQKIVKPVKHRQEQRAADPQDRYENFG
jgi:hypothetical protein